MAKPLSIKIPFPPRSSGESPIVSGSKTAPRASENMGGFRFSIVSPNYKMSLSRPSFLSPVHKKSEFNLLPPSNESVEMLDSSKIRTKSFSRMKKINMDDLTQEQLLELAITILQKNPDNRNNQDIKMLERSTKNVEFFQKYDKDTHEQICKYMTYQQCFQGQTVFEIGSQGETFFIILKGCVDVWVFLPRVVEETKLDGTIETRTEMALTNVRTLYAGNSFGELALMEKKPRAATIICREKCYFGILDKTSFDHILKEKEKRKLYEKIDFYASMKLFEKWSYNAVKMLYYQTELLDCIRNQQVLKEGHDPLGIYLIKSGEFKLMARILISFTDEEQEQYALSRGVLQDYYKTIELCVLNIGEVIGEEEIISGVPHFFSVYCSSNKGSLFFLNKKEFFRRVWSDENSKTYLVNSLKHKKVWREARIAEIIAMEKEKIFNKSHTKNTFNPKKINTHLLYKRLSKIRKDRETPNDNEKAKKSVVSNMSSQDVLNLTGRISNKTEKEIECYSGFKLQNVKKMELWEKFQEVKDKMNRSSTSFSKNSKDFLHKLTKGSDMPMKLMRDIGRFDSKSKILLQRNKGATSTNFNKSQPSLRETHEKFTQINTSFARNNYVKIQAFSSIKQDGHPETIDEAIGHTKFYSEEQKIESERKSITPFAATFFERKINGRNSANVKSLNRTLGKFKKNIRNIFVATADTGKRKKEKEMNLDGDSQDFFNVSSKTIYSKLI